MSKVRFILFPFAALFALITEFRLLLYKKGIFKRYTYRTPVISVGNLSSGGTGKTPHVLYIGEILSKSSFDFSVLSRGYGRKTKGFLEVESKSNPLSVGDEPLLFKYEFPKNTVAVCEKRVYGINTLLNSKTNTIILDDAYQHLAVKPSLNILLTDYNNLFYKDWVLPVGNLRELRKNKNRADLVIVTKCPIELSVAEQEGIIQHIKPSAQQKVFFSAIEYHGLKNINKNETIPISELKNKSIILITGIAKSEYLQNFLAKNNTILEHLNYADHHEFSSEDATTLLGFFEKHKIANPIIITTDKDAVKLSLISQIKTLPLFSIQIRVKFIQNEDIFSSMIINHVRKN